MDRKPDPIEGQCYYFPTQGEQRSTPKTTGKRKRAVRTKKTLEERLTEQESLNDNEQADSGIMYTKFIVTELRTEIAQNTTHVAWSMKKKQLSLLLYNRR